MGFNVRLAVARVLAIDMLLQFIPTIISTIFHLKGVEAHKGVPSHSRTMNNQAQVAKASIFGQALSQFMSIVFKPWAYPSSTGAREPTPSPTSEPTKARRYPDAPLFGQIFGTDMVDISVGTYNRRTFRVHRDFLCTQVPYFHEIFNGRSVKPRLDHMELPGDDPIAFALFLEWLYRRKYAPLNINDRNAFLDRIKLYCFADKIDLIELMDYTMTVLITNYYKHGKVPNATAAKFAYQNSDSNSQIRVFVSLLLASTLARTEEQDTSALSSEKYFALMMCEHDLGLDMVRLLRRNGAYPKPLPRPFAYSKCYFHVHEEGEQCDFTGDII